MAGLDRSGVSGFARGFLVLRGFSSGCAALTGVEAISNGVPAFKKPKSQNAATTLAMMAAISVSMMLVGRAASPVHRGAVRRRPGDQLLTAAPEGVLRRDP